MKDTPVSVNHLLHPGFQARFLLVLAVILVIFSALTASTIHRHELENLEENAHEKTELVMQAIEANRNYVQEVLRPAMYKELGTKRFVVEAMSSSFISRSIMERFSQEVPGFLYRRVAIGARNPTYEAEGFEREMIELFRREPDTLEWQGIREVEGKTHFLRFQPVVVKESCLLCHGEAKDAPADIITDYGDKAGFGQKLGDISGVVAVGLPIDGNLEKIKNFTFSLFLAVVPSIIVVYLIISTFFNRYIANNLRKILSFFRANIKDEEGRTIFATTEKMDEIDGLIATAKTVADHIRGRQTILEHYAEEILRSKNLLQSVFDGISDPVLLVGRQGRIRTVNRTFLNRYQMSMKQVIGEKTTELLAGKSCPLCLCEDLLNQLPAAPVSREVRLESGEIFLIYFYPMEIGNEGAASMVCYIKDITEQKTLEARIQHTEKIASIGMLAAGIAHEINNPLGVILCHIDLIKGEAGLPAEVMTDLETIEKHAGNCRSIIADLLKFAHRQPTVKEPCRLNALIAETIAMIGAQMRQQQITLQSDIDEDLPEMVADRDKIRQVLVNIILNSAQAIGEDGIIEVRSRFDREQQRAIIEIEDNGPGIPEEMLGKIFDPFFTSKPAGQGTGLGLAVSYGIVRDHNGEIAVTSTPGQLTRFTITLPLQGEEP
jgi:two-component system, NtrC family, sensor kinase